MRIRQLHVRYTTRSLPRPADWANVRSPAEAAAVFSEIIGLEIAEVCGALYLSAANEVLCYCELSRGTLDAAPLHPRDVLRGALVTNAAAVIVGHNHPSGAVRPSAEDLALTSRLTAAAEVFGVSLLDHVIVGRGGAYFSFKESGLIGGH